MKKLMTLVCAAFAVIIMAACGGGNSPKAVAEKSVKCLIDKDYKGYAELVYIDDEKYTGEEMDAQRKQVGELLEAKMPMALQKQGELKDYKVVSEEVAEDGNTATVEMTLTYEKDGEKKEKSDKIKLRKNKAGEWQVKM